MHRMLAFAPVPEDGTSRARAWGVYPQLRRKIPFHMIPVQQMSAGGLMINWHNLQDIDSVLMQRAFTQSQLQLCELAHLEGVPIIADYDDDLFTVPFDNPTHVTYGQPWVQKNIERVCQLAACVTASTETLAAKLRKFNPHVRVIPNALDLEKLKPLPQELPRNPIVVWRGSHCHVEDLREYADPILHAYEKFPNFKFMFVGYNPYWITRKMNPERYQVLMFDGSYSQYMRNLAKIRAAIQIVPLSDIEFNRSKSNIAFLEGSFAGSVCLTPKWDDWAPTPGVKYEGVNDFEGQLLQMMATPLPELAKLANEGFSWVERYRNLSLINDLRVDVLRKYARV